MKTIVNIGISIPKEVSKIKLDSFSSLSEADIAIFAPNFLNTSYSTYEGYSMDSGVYQGKRCFNKESSAKILEHSKHWKNELPNFVNNGGTLFLILSPKEEFYVYTGSNTVSGTGRNQKVTNHVTQMSNYDFLPFKLQYNSASGKTIIPLNPLVKDLYNNFKQSSYLYLPTRQYRDFVHNEKW